MVATAPRNIRYTRPRVASYQRAILDAPERYTVTEASTKVGKTASHIIWLFERALRGRTGDNYWWVAPIFQQAAIAFDRMRRQVTAPDFFVANKGDMSLTLPNGARIWFKSADKPDSLYGEDVRAAVFDEFTRAKEEAWYALRSTLTATKAPCKFIGNVRGKGNWGYKLAVRAKQGEKGYAYFKITAYDAVDAGILELDEIEQAKRDLPEKVFKELYLAEPADDGTNPFGLGHIRANVLDALARGPAVCYGVDLAKSEDYTVVVGLNASGLPCHFERWQGPWNITKKRLRELPDIATEMDSTGVGDPIVEELQADRRHLHGFKFSSTSKQQLMEGMAVALQERKTGILAGVGVDEFETFEFVYTRTGVRYSAPDGFHDDCVCAYALAWRAFSQARQRAPDIQLY